MAGDLCCALTGTDQVIDARRCTAVLQFSLVLSCYTGRVKQLRTDVPLLLRLRESPEQWLEAYRWHHVSTGVHSNQLVKWKSIIAEMGDYN